MQFKNSLVLLTALTASSASARIHGHERRHHQHQERAVGDWVTAVIDGQTVSWENTWAGATSAANANAPAATTVKAAAAAVGTAKNVAEAAKPSSDPTSTSASKTASATGFGATTAPQGSGSTYCGNHGNPYGSNIIEISKSELSSYDYTITLDGSKLTEDFNVIFWNKCDANHALTGFFGPDFPLTVTVSPGSNAYVAVDVDSQGGFIGYPSSSSIPKNAQDGIVLGFWGEFDFADANNNGWSGFDVSSIEADIAGISDFPGLLISGAGQTSSITTGLGAVNNAYRNAQADIGGIGGNIAPGPVALTAVLNYSG
ncbi:allergen, putative [Talaromyces stipitatus ATCC 10500]|uniref:Allergen, putative n=1 Tax=Talaromyces stipitatus (strain ATCC 10500 / CBS 375.48 / QM 6759 / NRRL 1006) TaxID=441959 RepID=B8M8F8_TALSN|nr:allergen, putative [Talaromyces stipitatus ATCC 10500]EED20471.1 allergen, putative [Talaromyces stipitatus ATCC 10500]